MRQTSGRKREIYQEKWDGQQCGKEKTKWKKGFQKLSKSKEMKKTVTEDEEKY